MCWTLWSLVSDMYVPGTGGRLQGAQQKGSAGHEPGPCSTDIHVVTILRCVIPVIPQFPQPHKGSHHLGHPTPPLRPPEVPTLQQLHCRHLQHSSNGATCQPGPCSREIFLHTTTCTKVRTYESYVLNHDHDRKTDSMISILPTWALGG